MQIVIGEGHMGMARIVRGSTERQLTEMCRQCVGSCLAVNVTGTGTGIHFLVHNMCVFLLSPIRKPKYFLNYGETCKCMATVSQLLA
jgi:hypothetical protein